VERSYGQPGVKLTYLKQGAEPNGTGGDKYAGLNCFGQVVDQRWLKTSTDRFQYYYDRDGNPLFNDNLVNDAYDELYHPNGAGNGYDKLNRLTEFRRGAQERRKGVVLGKES